MNETKIICQNKKARHNYFIEETLEAGLVLLGTEVKSLREGKANLVDSFADIQGGEVYLISSHISPYEAGNQFNHHPTRKRKLLLHKKEITRLIGKIREQGYNLIPLKVYFKGGRAKVELAVAKGKKLYDKRASIKKRQAEREIDSAMKNRKDSSH